MGRALFSQACQRLCSALNVCVCVLEAERERYACLAEGGGVAGLLTSATTECHTILNTKWLPLSSALTLCSFFFFCQDAVSVPDFTSCLTTHTLQDYYKSFLLLSCFFSFF